MTVCSGYSLYLLIPVFSFDEFSPWSVFELSIIFVVFSISSLPGLQIVVQTILQSIPGTVIDSG